MEMKNGITIGLGHNTDGKTMDWRDFGVTTVDDIKRKISVYAFGKPSIWTDIFVFQGKRNEFVIRNVKYNKKNDTYGIYFNDNINKIDKNWHEKIYATFVEHPLVSQYENINIQRYEMTDGKIGDKFMNLNIRLDNLFFQSIDTKTRIEINDVNNYDMEQLVDIRLEISEMDKIIAKKKDITSFENTEDKSELDGGTELKLNKDDVEKDIEAYESIIEKMLDDFRYLKENFVNRRIEMQANINKFSKINLLIAKINSSVNSESVQGYEKKNETEDVGERAFQLLVSKGMELLNSIHTFDEIKIENIQRHGKKKDKEEENEKELKINLKQTLYLNGCGNNKKLKLIGNNVQNNILLYGTDGGNTNKNTDISIDECIIFDLQFNKFRFFIIDDGG